MEDGVSWSGHERNVAWLNAGDGTFVDASAVVGFDQIEDGRVVCKVDWDRDGDLDLWLRSRNGVTLRYLENQSNPKRFVEVGSAARGEAGRRTSRSLRFTAGEDEVLRRVALPMTDGYLAAPARRTVVALPHDAKQISIDGESVEAKVAESGVHRLRSGGLELGDMPTRTVLRSPLPLPPSRLAALGVEVEREPKGRAARLLIVRSDSCSTCEAVLPDALTAITAGDVPVGVAEFRVSLELEALESDQAASARALREVMASVLGPGAQLALPLSLLLDERGVMHAIYQGDLEPETVALDARSFVLEPVPAAFRGGPPRAPFRESEG
ncbi:MAG: VCBS repeat-containing protein [Planctomycetota bacterium]